MKAVQVFFFFFLDPIAVNRGTVPIQHSVNRGFLYIIRSCVRASTENRSLSVLPERRAPFRRSRAPRESNSQGLLFEVEPRMQLRIGLELFQTSFPPCPKEMSTKTSPESCSPAGKDKNCPGWSLTTTRRHFLPSRSQRLLSYHFFFPLEIVDSQKAHVKRLRFLERVVPCPSLLCANARFFVVSFFFFFF